VLDRVGDSSINGGFILADSRPDQSHHSPLRRFVGSNARQFDTKCTGGIVRVIKCQGRHQWLEPHLTAEYPSWLIAHPTLPLMLLQRYPYRLGIKASQASEEIALHLRMSVMSITTFYA
jgi:hypothetical protein